MDYATIKKSSTILFICMLFFGSVQAQFGPLSVDFAKQNVICFGQSNGSILAVGHGGTPPYQYAWSTGLTESDDLVDRGSALRDLSAGTYTVTVTDAAGATAVQAIPITQPDELVANVSVSAPACSGATTGTITITATGGTLPYMFKIDDIGVVGSTTTGLEPGDYVIWVQDANFCTIDIIVTVPECEDDCPMVMAGNGGLIGADQYLCGPGNAPAAITEIAPPVWAEEGETLEYGWLMNVIGDTGNRQTWVPIPGATGPTYRPGPLRTTTLFRRCVRRPGCFWVESNTVRITVGTEAVANISAPYYICAGEPVELSTPTSGHFAFYSWNLGGVPGAPASRVYGASPTVVFSGPGGFGVISLTVKNGDCVSTHSKTVFVTDSPQLCGSGSNLMGNFGNDTGAQANHKTAVFPNPVTDELVVNLFNETEGRLEVYQADGKLLSTVALGKGDVQKRLNFSAYQQGIYIVKVIGDDGTAAVHRVVKQ